MTRPRFSIIVLTYAREAILAETLARLADYLGDRSDYELILVDNNPEPHDRSGLLDRFACVKVLWDGVNKGVAARNLGFDAAAGEYLILLDDDVFVETRDFLDVVAQRMDADPAIGAVTIAKHVRGETRRRVDLIPHTDKNVDLTQPFETFRFVGGFVAFRADALRETGGFLPDFFYGLEEVELSYRMVNRGWKILYDPAIVCEELEHPAGRRPKRDVQAERLANKLIISFLHMPSPYVWINYLLFPPYAFYRAEGDIDLMRAFRQFFAWLGKPGRRRRDPIDARARSYIRACGGSLWR
jgi:Predicted glycosyltransferases